MRRKKKAKLEHMYQSEDEEEVGKTMQTWNIKKRSMLPKGNPANLYYIKNDYSPSQMGMGTDHIVRRYHMTPIKSFRELYTHGAKHRHQAREGILRDIAGEWNQCSPLVIAKFSLFMN